MRLTLALTAVVLLAAGGGGINRATAEPRTPQVKKATCPDVKKGINYYRTVTWKWQRQLGTSRTEASATKLPSCDYAHWVAELWRGRSLVAKLKYLRVLEKQRQEDMTHIRRLERGLRGSPMEGTGSILLSVGKQYGISPYFMAGVAATESSLGDAACANNRYNVWGLANCDGRWHVPYFNSWREAITFYADFLRDRWPSARTPYDYHGYAACGSCWGSKTASHMRTLFGVSASSRF